ncbi:tetratricopeptide repeat protein [Pseudodesulfovibrio sp. JC047]|uniref:tetratricopeptide repeat protein n=1 Tax=Pseudodesulfovibrio sp. JC047 TaxID=2683199 RepID=UPI0013D2CE3A|nr:tetratricopeptide repeat protein [Pseudodesulfovibrio sp. JC047]NDV20541.1 tetratricopeptide repeat protein [Pseudodesulfovibrio sp. JC047]
MIKIAKNFTVLLLVLSMFSLIGCASKTDVEALQGDRQQDLNRMRQLESELEESRQLLKNEIEKSNSPIRERSADMWAEIQSLRADFAKLRGEMDEVTIRMNRQVGTADSPTTMDGLAERLAEIEFALENQLQVNLPKIREERAATLAASTVTPNDGTPPAEGGTTVSPETPSKQQASAQKPSNTDPAKALYDKAYALYKDNKFEKARSYWAEFTDTFKKHAYTPSAVYWQGQCYFKLKDYARAVILFEDVIEKYKKSSKYKSALLKAGYSWNYLGKPELAKMRYEEIVKKYPKSVEATQAKRSLGKMK